jgi:hypothetical protein
MQEASDALSGVLDGAGAYLPNRDSIDIRIVNDVKNRTGKIIDSQDEVGGWTDLNPGTAPEDTDRDGMPDDWEDEHNHLICYPNPNHSGWLDIDLPDTIIHPVTVMISTMNGEIMMNQRFDGQEAIRIEHHLIPGIYLMRLISGKDVYIQKFIIQVLNIRIPQLRAYCCTIKIVSQKKNVPVTN